MPSERRVLQVLQPEDGGVAEHVRLLATGLRDRGWEVEVACSQANMVRPALAAAGIPTHALPIARELGPDDLRAARALRAIDRAERFPIVHGHSSKAGGLARAALRSPDRLVYTPHCLPFAAEAGPARHLLYRAIEQLLVPRSAAIVAVCEWEREVAERALRGARPRLHVIRNGVPPCSDSEPDPALVEFKGDRPLAGLVTGLRPQKDPVAAVRAASLLAARGELAGRLAIVGNGELRPRVEEEIASLGVSEQVRWFPFEPPAGPYLSALDVFVLPARWEALPLGVSEAMWCGLPVVATRVGGIPEMVEDGRTGRLVAPFDSEELAAALGELLADGERRRELGLAGRALAERRFGVERMVDETEALYLDLLERRGTPAGGRRRAGRLTRQSTTA